MNRTEPRNAKIIYYKRFLKFLHGSSGVPLFFGGFLRSSIHYSCLIYIIYPKTPLACDESANCFRGKQLVCIQGCTTAHHFVCRNFSEDVYAMLGSRPGDGFKSQSQQKWKSCVRLERRVKCLFTNEMMIILMNRHLLENMLEVHLAHISPLHCHSADDRNIRIHHEEGEKNILSSNVNP